nr:hypothetical protein [Sedimentibacter sp.]
MLTLTLEISIIVDIKVLIGIIIIENQWNVDTIILLLTILKFDSAKTIIYENILELIRITINSKFVFGINSFKFNRPVTIAIKDSAIAKTTYINTVEVNLNFNDDG